MVVYAERGARSTKKKQSASSRVNSLTTSVLQKQSIDEAPATCWQKTFLESAPAQKIPLQVDSILEFRIWNPKWGPSLEKM